jgi:D-glycero-D-manno-heptose 1,7-bisphosphate phosphatase
MRETMEEINGYYYCPHLPEDDCDCRKPKPGMLFQALQEMNGDPKKSFMLGDKPSDLDAGQAAGVKSFLYEGGSLLAAVQRAVAEIG